MIREVMKELEKSKNKFIQRKEFKAAVNHAQGLFE